MKALTGEALACLQAQFYSMLALTNGGWEIVRACYWASEKIGWNADRPLSRRDGVAAVSQRLVAPKTWLGSEGVNVLKVLCDLLDLVQRMSTQLAGHTHGPTPVPGNAAAFTGYSSGALLLSTAIRPITL
jgi:hypothetical protein